MNYSAAIVAATLVTSAFGANSVPEKKVEAKPVKEAKPAQKHGKVHHKHHKHQAPVVKQA
jgi:hypothetical protein